MLPRSPVQTVQAGQGAGVTPDAPAPDAPADPGIDLDRPLAPDLRSDHAGSGEQVPTRDLTGIA